MDAAAVKYKYASYAIFLVVVLSVVISVVFKWKYEGTAVNFMGGDARDYYSSLVSLFITHDFTSQQASEWYHLKTATGTINVHPVGVALLLLPFFAAGYGTAALLKYPMDGYSLPFQIAVATAALVYAAIGLYYIKKLFQMLGVRELISALIILLIYFGTNLLNYTISEAGMSHVYSFAFIAAFLYHSAQFVKGEKNPDLFLSAVLFGLILLVRPNNVFVVLTVFLWFDNAAQCKAFFSRLVKRTTFYVAVVIASSIFFLQPLTWYLQSGSFIQNTYKRDGFYWLSPQIKEMLFGFDGGFFVYTPLCLLFLFGLIAVYNRSRFAFVSAVLFFAVLFYFFASYWAYTYFDGLGIRVLVDYYALFAVLGGLLFETLAEKKLVFSAVILVAITASIINLIYNYQANRGILLRAGMNFEKWKYVFLKTSPEYQNILGGSSELTPYAKNEPTALFAKDLQWTRPYNFSGREYGEALTIDSIGIESNRLRVNLACIWREVTCSSSKDTQVCLNVEDPSTKTSKCYTQFLLNETPSVTCCEPIIKNYSANLVGDFRAGDRLSVYLWNTRKRDFFVEKLAVKVYNYSYQLN